MSVNKFKKTNIYGTLRVIDLSSNDVANFICNRDITAMGRVTGDSVQVNNYFQLKKPTSDITPTFTFVDSDASGSEILGTISADTTLKYILFDSALDKGFSFNNKIYVTGDIYASAKLNIIGDINAGAIYTSGFIFTNGIYSNGDINTIANMTVSGNSNINSMTLTGDILLSNGTTISQAELLCLDGATSNLQTQLTSSHTSFTTVLVTATQTTTQYLTATVNTILNNLKINGILTTINSITISPTELSYLKGLTSNIQAQISAGGNSDPIFTSLTVSGAVTLPAASITDANLSANVLLLYNTQSISGQKSFNNPSNIYYGNTSYLQQVGAGHPYLQFLDSVTATVPNQILGSIMADTTNLRMRFYTTFTNGFYFTNNIAITGGLSAVSLTISGAVTLPAASITDANLSANVLLLDNTQSISGQKSLINPANTYRGNFFFLQKLGTTGNPYIQFLDSPTAGVPNQLLCSIYADTNNERMRLDTIFANGFYYTSDITTTGSLKAYALTLTGAIIANTTIITVEQLAYLSGATSNIQTQLNTLAAASGVPSANINITGSATMGGNLTVNQNAYISGSSTIYGALNALGSLNFTINSINDTYLTPNVVLLNSVQTISGAKTFSGIMTLTNNIVANLATITPLQLSYISGTTSNIQTQCNTLTTTTGSLQTQCNTLTTTTGSLQTQCNTLSTTSGSLQTQINTLAAASGTSPNVVLLDSAQTITGAKTFSGIMTLTNNISANAATITPVELSYISGTTSNIQTQLNNATNGYEKIATISNTYTCVKSESGTTFTVTGTTVFTITLPNPKMGLNYAFYISNSAAIAPDANITLQTTGEVITGFTPSAQQPMTSLLKLYNKGYVKVISNDNLWIVVAGENQDIYTNLLTNYGNTSLTGNTVIGNLTVSGTSDFSASSISDSALSNNITFLNSYQVFTATKGFNNGINVLGGSVVFPSGSINDSYLSSNVVLLNTIQTFTAVPIFQYGLSISSGGVLSLPVRSLADNYLTTNVALLTTAQTFIGSKTFTGAMTTTGALTTGTIDAASITCSNNFTFTNNIYSTTTTSYMRQFVNATQCYYDYCANLLFRSVGATGTTTGKQVVFDTNGIITAYGMNGRAGTSGATTGTSLNFYYTGGALQVWNNTTNLGSATICDYRLKENIKPSLPILDRLCAIPMFQYELKNTGIFQKNGKHIGCYAHELKNAFPELDNIVFGEKDEMTEDNTIQPQSLTNEVPLLLMKAIQELNEKNNQLKQEIDDLKKKPTYGAPVGTVIQHISATLGSPYLLCDGKVFDSNIYSSLFEVLGTNTTPNLSGRFIITKSISLYFYILATN